MGELRLFVAVPLTGRARMQIDDHLRTHLPGGVPGRPVRPEQWHLTLRFLGGVAPAIGDRVLGYLHEADLAGPFRIRFGPLGAFPQPRRATVLWLGIDSGAECLARLADAAEEAAAAAGLPPEDRPFHAHLTLSRIRPHQDVTPLLAEAPPLGASMEVDRVVLYESHLGPGGARYEEVDAVAL